MIAHCQRSTKDAVPQQLAGRWEAETCSSSQLTKLSQMLQMLGTGGCVLLQMSPLILLRQSMPPVVTAVQCQCQVTLTVAAWLSQVRERWGNSDTFSNSVDKALGCKLRGISTTTRKNILHTLTTGGIPSAPWIRPCWHKKTSAKFMKKN